MLSIDLIGTGIVVATQGQAFVPSELISFYDTNAQIKIADLTASIDWGDGTDREPGQIEVDSSGNIGVFGTHFYNEEGAHPIAVEVDETNNTSNFLLASTSAQVNYAPLANTQSLLLKATQGVVMANVVVAGFGDSGTPDPVPGISAATLETLTREALSGQTTTAIDSSTFLPQLLGRYSATINWGDGTTPTTGIVQADGANFQVSGSHSYARQGDYLLGVTIAHRGINAIPLPVTGQFGTAADLTNDGRQDLVFYQIKPTSTNDQIILTTLINKGDGSFVPSPSGPAIFYSPYPPDIIQTVKIQAIDLDGNGLKDLVVTVNTDASFDPGFAYDYINQGGGVFQDAQAHVIGVAPQGDTIKDLAVEVEAGVTSPNLVIALSTGTDAPGSLQVYHNAGNGVFTATGQAIALDFQPLSVKYGDLNNNGVADLAVAGAKSTGSGSPTGVFTTLLGFPGSGFTTPATEITGLGSSPAIFGTADVNGDGSPDFVVNGGFEQNISILLNGGNGTFAQAPGSPIDLSSFYKTLENVASQLSLVTIGRTLDVLLPTLESLLDGNGQTGQAENVAAKIIGLIPFQAYIQQFYVGAIGDFNGDGLTDFVGGGTPLTDTTSFNAGTQFLLEGTSTTTTFYTPAIVAPHVADDYDGDGKSDLAVYLPAIGAFGIRPSGGGGDQIVPFGIPGGGQTIPVPGDYNGDGKDDLAVYLPALGAYGVRSSSGTGDKITPFGIPGYGQSIPAPGDYFGTGQTDLAVYLPVYGEYAILEPNGQGGVVVPFGIPGSGQTIPAPGDYNGDGVTDIAVYLPAFGAFGVRDSGGGGDHIIPFGIPGYGQSIPMPGDYDGSGKTELAVYLPSLGLFAFRPADGGPDVVFPIGAPGTGQSLPTPGDYAGIGSTQVALYVPYFDSYLIRTFGRPDEAVPFGIPGYGQTVPVTAVIDEPLAGDEGPNAAGSSIRLPRAAAAGPPQASVEIALIPGFDTLDDGSAATRKKRAN